MGYIKDRVLAKVKSWNEINCDMEPAYTMSYFKLPKKLWNEINCAVAKFWWGQKENEGKFIREVG